MIDITLALRGGRVEPRIVPAPDLPVAAMLLGREAETAVALLPRLFNLCPAAQGLAVRLALGLPVTDPEALAREICREHLLKLFVIWPNLLGLPIRPPPQGEAPALRMALFGSATAPGPDGFDTWLAGGAGLAPLFRAIAERFRPHEATAPLPPVPPAAVMTPGGFDNSPAARRAGHPLLMRVAERSGPGPLWRALGRLVDLDACLTAAPAPLLLADGTAIVPAARGSYGVLARSPHGVVTAFRRVTPTDHLCSAGGVLERSLASLPADRARLAPLLVDILDPCTPVRLRETQDA